MNLTHDSKFKLGFCDNPKRLNVAISRAKDLLVIVGNGKLFGSNDPNWAALLAYLPTSSPPSCHLPFYFLFLYIFLTHSRHFKQHNLFKGAPPTWHYTPTVSNRPATTTTTTSTGEMANDDVNADQGWNNDNN